MCIATEAVSACQFVVIDEFYPLSNTNPPHMRLVTPCGTWAFLWCWPTMLASCKPASHISFSQGRVCVYLHNSHQQSRFNHGFLCQAVNEHSTHFCPLLSIPVHDAGVLQFKNGQTTRLEQLFDILCKMHNQWSMTKTVRKLYNTAEPDLVAS